MTRRATRVSMRYDLVSVMLLTLPHSFLLDVLFDFQIDVRDSSIPGAGKGAFLTYLGARRLKPACVLLGDQEMKKRASTKEELQATMPSGHGCTVKICGENLHGNNNSDFWLEAGKEDPFVAAPEKEPERIGWLKVRLNFPISKFLAGLDGRTPSWLLTSFFASTAPQGVRLFTGSRYRL